MSAHDNSAGERRLPEARVHLLAADDLLTDCYPRRYLTLCGQVLTGADLAHSTCEDDCGCDVLYYCPRCIHDAVSWNTEIDGAQPSRAVQVR